jgi:hypothetical protein
MVWRNFSAECQHVGELYLPKGVEDDAMSAKQREKFLLHTTSDRTVITLIDGRLDVTVLFAYL